MSLLDTWVYYEVQATCYEITPITEVNNILFQQKQRPYIVHDIMNDNQLIINQNKIYNTPTIVLQALQPGFDNYYWQFLELYIH